MPEDDLRGDVNLQELVVVLPLQQHYLNILLRDRELFVVSKYCCYQSPYLPNYLKKWSR